MSFRFNDQESVPDGVRRMAIEQIDKALERSASKQNGYRDAVHDIRVCCKKIRGVLRLVRGGLDADVFQKQNQFYRDVGRRLGPLRNPAALAEAYDQLVEHFGREVSRARFAGLRPELRLDEAYSIENAAKTLREVANNLRDSRRRIERWPVECDSDFSTLGWGLGETYKRGRRAFATAYEKATTAAFHEWRKSVKYLWYQVRVLRPVWPAVMKALAGELESLGDALSGEHDLALLRRKALGAGKSGKRASEDIEVLVALIDRRRAELRSDAKELGARIYAARRRDFQDRIGAYWTGWREGAM